MSALGERQFCLYREGEATPVNMFTSTLSNQFITRAGEVPAEPMRRQLGGSLALPLEDSAGRFRIAAHT